MVKHTQAIRRQFPKIFLSVFDHFVGLALKGLKNVRKFGRNHSFIDTFESPGLSHATLQKTNSKGNVFQRKFQISRGKNFLETCQ